MKKTFFTECDMLQLKPWQCPPILFIVMGFFIILSMLATYVLAQRYTDEPEIAALTVIFITVVAFIIGTFIVSGFSRLVEAHRIKSQFVSLASHQLRSPLSVLKWTLEAGRSGYHAYSPQELENFMNTLGSATENMIRLVDMLIDINRIDSGTFVPNTQPIAPGELAVKAFKHFKTSLDASHITANLIIPDGLPNVHGDERRVTAILERLIDNAIRYTPAGGSITLHLEKIGTYVQFSVEDSGIGIPRADQPHVFEKFFRSANASRVQTEGAGTGLYIARAVIERLGGSISFSSEEGKGSRFTFTLPIRDEDVV